MNGVPLGSYGVAPITSLPGGRTPILGGMGGVEGAGLRVAPRRREDLETKGFENVGYGSRLHAITLSGIAWCSAVRESVR